MVSLNGKVNSDADASPLTKGYVRGERISDGPLSEIALDSFNFVKNYFGFGDELAPPTVLYGGEFCTVYVDESRIVSLSDSTFERPWDAVEEITHWLQHKENPALFDEKRCCLEENARYCRGRNWSSRSLNEAPARKRRKDILTLVEGTAAIAQLWYADEKGILERALEDINPERFDDKTEYYPRAYEMARTYWRMFSSVLLRRQLLLAQSLEDVHVLVQ